MYTTEELETILSECRTFKLSRCLSHQYISQFGKSKADALSTVGSTVVQNVNKTDADFLSKDLRGLVKPTDILELHEFEAIVRIGLDIVKIKTREPLKLLKPHFREKIIEESRRKYYKPVDEIKREKRDRYKRLGVIDTPLSPAPPPKSNGTIEEFEYDEF